MEESLLDDIQSKRSLNLLKQLKTSIIDCAKNLKSNDEIFNINTMPNVCDNLTDLMSQYVDSIQLLEASQRTFAQLQKNVSEDDQHPDGGEPVDLEKFRILFDQTLERELSETVTDEAEAQVELNTLIRQSRPPQQAQPTGDEDVYVEQNSVREIPKDPITKKNIKIAVRSTRCNHLYDQASINAYIDQNKHKARCPIAGCSNKCVKKSELELDEATNALISSLM